MLCKYCNGNFVLKKEKYTFMDVEYIICERCRFTELDPDIIKAWKKEHGAKIAGEKKVETKEEKPKKKLVLVGITNCADKIYKFLKNDYDVKIVETATETDNFGDADVVSFMDIIPPGCKNYTYSKCPCKVDFDGKFGSPELEIQEKEKNIEILVKRSSICGVTYQGVKEANEKKILNVDLQELVKDNEKFDAKLKEFVIMTRNNCPVNDHACLATTGALHKAALKNAIQKFLQSKQEEQQLQQEKQQEKAEVKEEKKKIKIIFKPEKKEIFEEKVLEIDEKTDLLSAAKLAGININEKSNLIILNGTFINSEKIIKASPEESCVVSASLTYPLSDLEIIVPVASLSKEIEKAGVKKFKIIFEREIEGKIAYDSCEIDEKTSLLSAAGLLNININAACGGKGICKKCKILIKSGEFLNKDKIYDNYVLACMCYPKSDINVFVPKESIGEEDTSQVLMERINEKIEITGDIGFAIDIGTTTIVAYAVDLSTGKVFDGEGCYNPQRVYGGDVLARMDYAKKNHENRKELQKLVVNAINKLVGKIIKRRNLKINQIKKYILSGNVVMTYLFLGKDTEEIRFNPNSENYKKFYNGKARDLNLIGNDETQYYTVPGIGAYVGGDISSDILCTEMLDSENFSMLIDIGTNGQIVIGNKNMLIGCATSAGPAFEGGGIECGMRASEGAIEDVKILDVNKSAEKKIIDIKVINNVKPRGICGSGLINLISEMFKKGIINYKGEINRELKNNENFKDRIVINNETGNDKFIIVKAEENDGREIYITKNDIENLIYAKAAIYTGIYTLTQISGIPFESIDKIYIAGGFGSSIDFSNATNIGLFPKLDLGKFVFIGNGSAKGSSLILANEKFMEKAKHITEISTYIDLASNKIFNEEYVKAIFIPHLEMNRFE